LRVVRLESGTAAVLATGSFLIGRQNIESVRTILELDCDRLILALHKKPARIC
jgi:hypothetical protein